jgi:hypothetical protein
MSFHPSSGFLCCQEFCGVTSCEAYDVIIWTKDDVKESHGGGVFNATKITIKNHWPWLASISPWVWMRILPWYNTQRSATSHILRNRINAWERAANMEKVARHACESSSPPPSDVKHCILREHELILTPNRIWYLGMCMWLHCCTLLTQTERRSRHWE